MKSQKLWLEQAADMVEKEVAKAGRSGPIVCASGISPSGPIHLGNLREVMTTHLVAEALRRRGHQVDHIHSWDDFDRLRKVPEGVPGDFAQHVGTPLAWVPDPRGEYESYALRYLTDFTRSLERLGVQPRFVRQSQAYQRGDYIELTRRAIEHRGVIFDILAEYQGADRHEKSADERREEYYPYKLYCARCKRDDTRIVAYDPATTAGEYECQHGDGRMPFVLTDRPAGKLVWKVDWPMRWHHERVDFEPGGEDHSSPGGSLTVGRRIVHDVFGGAAPAYLGYAFVGIAGRSKMSSSMGQTVTPASALEILEPAMVRWLYIRRNSTQKFNIDFGTEVLRLYDEWDAFSVRARKPEAAPDDRTLFESSVRTSAGEVATTPRPVSFRLLASSADITQGNVDQVLRIVRLHVGDEAPPPAAELEPRLGCAINWATRYVPEDERTHIRDEFSVEAWTALSDQDRRGVQMLVERLDPSWTLDGLTTLVYGTPKLLLGLPIDAPPSEPLKVAQRGFFKALYSLLLSDETGPRLPTLFLSLGAERVRKLLTPPPGVAAP
jgi:lysyl-tRNA synthetase class 1